jgi:hypothetical protein
MSEKSVFVRVLAGTVLACVLCGAASLRAAEKKPPKTAPHTAPQGGRVVGIVTAKSDKDIMVKAEGDDEAKRYLLAAEGATPKPELQAAMKAVFVPNLVMLESQGQDPAVVTGIRVMLPNARQGVVAGTVVARGNTPKEAWIDVKPSDRGYTQRYWPRFVGAPDGFDKEMVRIFGELNVGDKVKVGWGYDERIRAAQIQVVSRATEGGPAKKEGKTPPKSSSRAGSDR